ncbi:MAG: flavin reductase [Clostridia bacterium]|nr:flavin reductase [Clostridia bacterium]
MKEIEITALQFNPFEKIGKEWMLITAGDENAHNTMTASWGGLGVIWNKNVSTCYVRPQRHTFGFMENSEFYSLCFFDESYRNALSLCGTLSGRDTDKDKEAGLTCAFHNGVPYYEEASLVLICRKLYSQFLTEESFADKAVYAKNYPLNDLHKMYIGEITAVLVKE